MSLFPSKRRIFQIGTRIFQTGTHLWPLQLTMNSGARYSTWQNESAVADAVAAVESSDGRGEGSNCPQSWGQSVKRGSSDPPGVRPQGSACRRKLMWAWRSQMTWAGVGPRVNGPGYGTRPLNWVHWRARKFQTHYPFQGSSFRTHWNPEIIDCHQGT